jgi:hypothetical protein
MKKALSLTIIVIFLLSVCGCGIEMDPGVEILWNEQFAVKELNGERYLDFHNDSYRVAANAISQSSGLKEGYKITFKSIKEMKECIEQGKFTEDDLLGMQTFAKASNGKVSVCNTNALYDLKLPADTSLKEISWKGANYTFLAEKGLVAIGVKMVSKEVRDNYIASWDVESNSNLKVVSKEVESDSTTTIVYDNLAFNYRSRIVLYTATVEGSVITYMEHYDYEKSKDLPWGISFWGENAGGYFYGTISGFEEIPSRDWLTSIAVVPYTEN